MNIAHRPGSRPWLALVVTLATAALTSTPAAAELITYWNFNDYDGAAHSIAADAGSGVLQIDPGWDSSDLGNETGTIKNTLFGDPIGTALTLYDNLNNDRWIDWHVDTTDYQGIVMRFAIRSTTTGFKWNDLSWSVDGGDTFIQFGTFWGGDTTWPVLDFSLGDYTELDNQSEVIFRFTMDSATSSIGSTRIDNMRISGGLIPAPGVLGLYGVVGLLLPRRRRQGHALH
jgi:hypothetical protein